MKYKVNSTNKFRRQHVARRNWIEGFPRSKLCQYGICVARARRLASLQEARQNLAVVTPFVGLKCRCYVLHAARITSGACAGSSTFLSFILHLLDFIVHIGKALHSKVTCHYQQVVCHCTPVNCP